ncbi:MAG: hydrogenase expression protein HupG [Candidatus Poribacteria bacterium]|nr:MAG: hydrogenase expression protein HupG [Candidatus Poribacteria bacterium]
MHEWALAEAIVRAVAEHAAKERIVRVRRVVVQIGQMQQIQPKTLERLVQEVLAKEYPTVRGAEFLFEEEPAQLHCRRCGHRWMLADALESLDPDAREAIHFLPELAHSYLRCPVCRSPDFQLLSGRGVTIATIQGEVEQ